LRKKEKKKKKKVKKKRKRKGGLKTTPAVIWGRLDHP
jgi:hypothetical protein